MTYRFSVMITKEDDRYVARCPELGGTPQGKDVEGARANLAKRSSSTSRLGACPRQPDAHALCDYRLATRSSTYAFTVSKASAEFVNRLRANADSVSRKNASRSSSSANSIATPRSLSGASVGIARNSLTLSPRSPGNVAQPS